MINIVRNLQVGKYSLGDEEDILGLNLTEYGPKNVMVSREAFKWRFEGNPTRQTEITVVKDREKGRVVGFTWTIPMSMRIFGKNYIAALTANQLVHPDYRDSLAYARLSRYRQQTLQDQGIPFRYSFPIEAIYKRINIIDKMSSFDLPLLLQPLNISMLARQLIKNASLSRLIELGGRVATPLIFRNRNNKDRSDGYKIEWLQQFDGRFDEFWERVQDKYSIMTVRNRAFLSWRFAPVDKRKYKILAVTAENDMVGYVVLRCTDEIREIPIGLVMDILLEPGPRGESAGLILMMEAGKYFHSEGVWLAGGLTLSHTSEYRVMHQAGYQTIPQRWSPRQFRVAYKCYSNDLPETEKISDMDWFVTLADYEAH